GFHQGFHASVHRIQIQAAAGEEIIKRSAFGGSFGMKGKVDPLDLYVEILSQLFNTPGTEVTPRSNEIGKDLHLQGFICHVLSMAQVWKFSAKHGALGPYLKLFSKA